MYSGRGKRRDQKEYNDRIAAWNRGGDICILNILRFAETRIQAERPSWWNSLREYLSLQIKKMATFQQIAKCSKCRYLLACSTQVYDHYILFDRGALLFPNTFTIPLQYILTQCKLLPVTFPHLSFPLYFPAENYTKTAILPS